jgi:hypothetical protein
MKTIPIIMLLGLCAGCVHRGSPLVQDWHQIIPPIKHAKIYPGLDDGGTIRADITDANDRIFVIYVDKRAHSKTPGEVYLNAYPSEAGSVHIVNQQEFRQEIGDFDKDYTKSF